MSTEPPPVHIARRDPLAAQERKTLDELMLDVCFKVDGLAGKVDSLQEAIEKREPAPRAAVWLAAISIFALAVGYLWTALDGRGGNNAVQAAGLHGAP